MKNLIKYLMIFALIFSEKNLHSQNWVIYNTSNSNIPHETFPYMAIDSSNTKWFVKILGSGTQVWKFDNDTTWTNVFNTPYANVRDFECDLHNSQYLALLNSPGVYEFTSGTWQATSILAFDVAIDTNNIKWFATSNGLTEYDGSTFTSFDTGNSTIPFASTYKVITDKQNNIWIAGDNGIAKSSNSGSSWTVYNSSNCSLLVNQIKTMVVDNSDNLWIGFGSSSGGAQALGVLKFDGNIWTNYTTTNSGINTDYVWCLAVDVNNRLYISNIDPPSTGLCVFDGTNWTTYSTSNSPLPHNSIYSIRVDRYNNKWLCTVLGVVIFNESGVVSIDETIKQTKKSFIVYPNPLNDKASIDFELDNSQTVTIEINNLLAEKISTKKVLSHKGKNTATIDVSLLPKGIYIVKIITDKQIESKKIIKE